MKTERPLYALSSKRVALTEFRRLGRVASVLAGEVFILRLSGGSVACEKSAAPGQERAPRNGSSE